MQVVIETPDYLADAKSAGLTGDERRAIVDFVAKNPDAGVEMKGTGGARKIRFAGRGKGKSGGYRVVTFFLPVATFRSFCSRFFQRVKKPICHRPKETN